MSWIIVKDLPERTDEKELRTLFSFAGDATENILLRDADGQLRPFAFVGFEKDSDATLACAKLKRKTVLSIPVQAEIARPAVISEYGKLVPINDASYVKKTDELNDPVLSIRESDDGIFLQTTSNEYVLVFKETGAQQPLSLGEALKRRGACQKLVGSNTGRTSLLKAQVVATNLMKTVASAGTAAADSFLKDIKVEDSKETSHVMQILSEEDVNDSLSLSRTISSYLKSGRTVKEELLQKTSNLGLQRLPSANLAAATVARCLIEIRRGNFGFVVPFIDILGVVAVSNSAIRGYLSMFVNKFKINRAGLVSIIGILNQRETIHGMEAAILSIPDLPEFEIVRATQCAVRIRKQCVGLRKKLGGSRICSEPPAGLTETQRKSWAKNEHVILKVHRLLLRCVVAPVNRVGLMKGLKSVTIDDVKHLLDYFAVIVSAHSTRSPLGYTNKSSLFEQERESLERNPEYYRGIENWMDREFNSLQAESEELQGCIVWTCALLDAHMSSLLVDAESCQLLAFLLKHVTKQRECSESILSVLGAVEHVEARIPVPTTRQEIGRYKMEINAAF